MNHRRAFFFLLVLLTTLTTQAEVFSGNVLSVINGDTIIVDKEGAPIKVRLYGVDAPEIRQEFGLEAKDFVSGLCLNQQVLVDVNLVDRYSCNVSTVSLPDGRVLNNELIVKGYAWCNSTEAPDKPDQRELQEKAKSQQLGLWKNSSAVAPWTFREVSNTVVPARSDTDTQASNGHPLVPTLSAKGTMTESRPRPARSTVTPIHTNQAYRSYPSSYPSSYSSVAENGSYYGQISENTGRPKTVHVNGYTRKDGTYVRGHYRSSPGH